MRILIAGENEVAFRLAEALMADHDVVLLIAESASPRTDRLDVETVSGPAYSTRVLRDAKAGRADLFVACSPADEQNLVACVAAKHLGADQTVCFLFGREFQVSEAGRSSLTEFLGIDMVVRPAEQLAQEFLRIVTVPGALDFEVFAGGKVHLLRKEIEEGAAITQGKLREIGVPPGVVLVMARRGDEIFLPKGDTQLEAGDKVTAMGSLVGINRLLFSYLRPADRGMEAHRATVVGGGLVGFAVAQGLEEAGWEVRVIEADAKRCEEISPQLKSMVLLGDGTDWDLLEQERVGEDSVVVAVTSNDEKNLLVSLLAKQLGVPRILTRADQVANERLFEKVGIDVVRSATGAAANSVIYGVVRARHEMLAELEHGDAMVLELVVPDGLAPTPLSELRAPVFAIIGAILRDRNVIIPQGRDAIQGGDRILVFCIHEDEEKVRNFFLRKVVKERG